MYAPTGLQTAEPVKVRPYTRLICLFLVCIAPLLGCNSTPTSSSERLNAQNAVEAWLELLDGEDYEATWQATAGVLKRQVTLEQWRDRVSAVRSALGEVQSRRPISASYSNNLTDTPAGDYIIFQFQTQFEEQTNAVETVTVVLDNHTWRAVGYFVR